ncbi:MAG: permease [Candidatus Thermoplasmatota archaeon]
MILDFAQILWKYIIDVLPPLLIGLFIAGLIYELVPSEKIGKWLGGKGIAPIAYASLIGIFMPLCCYGTIPIAFTLYKKGAKLGPVLAFLVATPATSITALLVCFALLGWKFTLFIFCSVFLMSLSIGCVGNTFKFEVKSTKHEDIDPVCGMRVIGSEVKTSYRGETYYFCAAHCKDSFEKNPEKYIGAGERKLKDKVCGVLHFAFVDTVKDIGPWLILGLILATIVVVVIPEATITTYLSGCYGFLFSLVFGLSIYFCATGTVPFVHALIVQGMSVGAGLTLLLVGPITNYGQLLIIRKEFKNKILVVYLAVVCFMSLTLGFLFSLVA